MFKYTEWLSVKICRAQEVYDDIYAAKTVIESYEAGMVCVLSMMSRELRMRRRGL